MHSRAEVDGGRKETGEDPTEGGGDGPTGRGFSVDKAWLEEDVLQHSSCIGHLWYFMWFLFTLSLLGTLAPTLFLLQFCFTDQRTVR